MFSTRAWWRRRCAPPPWLASATMGRESRRAATERIVMVSSWSERFCGYQVKKERGADTVIKRGERSKQRGETRYECASRRPFLQSPRPLPRTARHKNCHPGTPFTQFSGSKNRSWTRISPFLGRSSDNCRCRRVTMHVATKLKGRRAAFCGGQRGSEHKDKMIPLVESRVRSRNVQDHSPKPVPFLAPEAVHSQLQHSMSVRGTELPLLIRKIYMMLEFPSAQRRRSKTSLTHIVQPHCSVFPAHFLIEIYS